MAHTSSTRGNRHHRMLVSVACPYSWEDGAVEWHSSSAHTNYRYFWDLLSWKATTRAPKQWARHKRGGVGPFTFKRSLEHLRSDREEQMLTGADEFISAHLEFAHEYKFA